ncbi:hypothetical protein, partial [Ideonella livida]
GAAVLAERPGAGTPLPAWPQPEAWLWFDPTAAGVAEALADGPEGAAFAAQAQAACRQHQQALAGRRPAAFWSQVQAWWQVREAVGEVGGAPAPTTATADSTWLAPPPGPDRLNDAMSAECPDGGYRPGWFNLAPAETAATCGPDRVGTLAELLAPDPAAGRWRLVDLGAWDPTQSRDLIRLAQSAQLLAPGGRVLLRWAVPGAVADLSAAETALAQALAPWCSQFWRSVGPQERQRWVLAHHGWLQADGLPAAPAGRPAWARVVLTRRDLTLAEAQQRRAQRWDLGL